MVSMEARNRDYTGKKYIHAPLLLTMKEDGSMINWDKLSESLS